MRICFKLIAGAALWIAAASAADSTSAPQKVTTVIRSDPHSGRLVRSVVVTSKSVGQRTVAATVIAPRVVEPALEEPPAPAPTGIDDAVEQIAAANGLKPELLHSVIKVESNYNPNAVSPKGARGLMQLIPATARRFGVSDAFNPVENIQGGAKYLRYLLDLYDNNYPLALAAYNAGEAAVAKYGGVPPYRETQNYLVLVKHQLDKAAGRKPAPPAKTAAPEGEKHVQQIVETDGTVRYVLR